MTNKELQDILKKYPGSYEVLDVEIVEADRKERTLELYAIEIELD